MLWGRNYALRVVKIKKKGKFSYLRLLTKRYVQKKETKLMV